MSGFKKFQQEHYLHDPVAAAKNKVLAQRNRKANIFVRMFRWLTSLEDRLLREIIVNWLIVISPIVFVICVLTTWDYIFETSSTHVQDLGVGFMVSMVSFITFIVAVTLKIIYRSKKKKGTYWPEYKRPKNITKKENKKE